MLDYSTHIRPIDVDMDMTIPSKNREQFLDQAEAAVWRTGFAKMKINEVARSSSIPKAEVYRVFENKEKIGSAIVIRHSNAVFRQQSQLASYSNGSWRDRLAALLLVPVEVAHRKYEAHSCSGDVAATIFGLGRWGWVRTREVDLISNVLRSGQVAGEFRVGNVGRTAKIFSMALATYLPPYIWIENPINVLAEAREAINALLAELVDRDDR